MTPTTLYSSFYWRRVSIDGHVGRQFKVWVGYLSGADQNYFSAGLGTSEGGEDASFRQHVSGVAEQWLSTQSTACLDAWCRIENYIKYSTSATGQWDSSVHTTSGVENVTRSNIVTTGGGTPQNHDFIGAYFDMNAGGTGNSYVDSAKFILANNPARVELCAGSTWANRGTCDYQRATSWASGSATVVPDTLSFSNGSTAYVYVCDDTNACNASGYSVTINGSAVLPAPANFHRNTH